MILGDGSRLSQDRLESGRHQVAVNAGTNRPIGSYSLPRIGHATPPFSLYPSAVPTSSATQIISPDGSTGARPGSGVTTMITTSTIQTDPITFVQPSK